MFLSRSPASASPSLPCFFSRRGQPELAADATRFRRSLPGPGDGSAIQRRPELTSPELNAPVCTAQPPSLTARPRWAASPRPAVPPTFRRQRQAGDSPGDTSNPGSLSNSGGLEARVPEAGSRSQDHPRLATMARCTQFEQIDRSLTLNALCAEDYGDINLLPDDILIGIISRLTIHDAVVTGRVSTRWRHLWKSVTSLRFNSGSINLKGKGRKSEQAAQFAGMVRSVLCHHSGVGVNDFLFALPHSGCCHPHSGCCHTAELDQAMEFAAVARTKKLGFLLDNIHCSEHAGPPYDFPHWRFAGGHLQMLMLSRVGLNVAPSRVGLNVAPQMNLEGLAQLTNLNLARVVVDDCGLANILSTCGNLIALYLQKCQQLVHMNMSHARLRVLDVFQCGDLKSITIQSSTLIQLVYTGHKVDIKYRHTPAMVKLKILLCMMNECPLDCVSSAASFPNLKQLFLEFPSPLHAASCTQLQRAQHNHQFASLNQIVLLLKTPWKDHISSVAYLLIATPLVKELRIETYYNLRRPPRDNLMIQWPERFSMKKLQSIIIGGFSGETELMELTFFLLQSSPALQRLAIDTQRWHLQPGYWAWDKDTEETNWHKEKEDRARCCYARGVAWTHLVPNIPSTVKFSIL